MASVRSFSKEVGITNRVVKAVFQDSRGLIWLGTSEGLHRFDAYDFKRYDQKSCGLGLPDVLSISEDGDGWLWLMGGGASAWLFHPYSEDAVTFENRFAADAPCAAVDIQNGFFGAPDGSVWFALKNRPTLVQYHPKLGWKVTDLPQFKQIELFGVSATNTIWCVADGSDILEFDAAVRPLRTFPNEGQVSIRSKEKLFRNGFYFTVSAALGHKQYLYFMNAAGEISRLPDKYFVYANSSYPEAMCAFGNTGLVWANNQLIDPSKGVVIDLSDQIPHYLNYGLRAFLEDSEGRFWVGGEFGVVQVEIQTNQFVHYFSDQQKTAPSTACRGISLIDGQLFVQLERKGLYSQDLAKKYAPKPIWPNTFLTGSYGLYQAPSGRIFAGFAKEIRRYDPKTQQSNIWTFPERVEVWSFYEDSGGRLWIGTSHGLFFGEGADGPRLSVEKAFKQVPELSSAHVFHIAPDRQGNIWLCTNKGLFAYSEKQSKLMRFWSGGQGDYHLPSDTYHHFYLDMNGCFWLASAESGLVQWALPFSTGIEGGGGSGIVKVLDKTNGLPSNSIYAIYADQHHNLWISTNAGLVRLNPSGQRIQTWIEENGILNKEFNRISHYMGADGRLYFGGLNGVVAVDPTDLGDISAEGVPPFQLIDFYQFNLKERQMVDKTGELILSKTIKLSPAHPMCHLNFSLLDYEYMDEVLYAYRLEGLDSAWHFQPEHSLSLGNLPAGEYVLKIKGRTSTGEWSQLLTYSLIVEESLWAKSFVYARILMGLCLFVWGGIVLYKRLGKPRHSGTAENPSSVNIVGLESDKHREWLLLLEETARSNIGDYDFSLDALAETMGMSDRHLRRKLKEASGLTTSEYLREIRLQKAMQLLELKAVTSVSELAFAVGMRDVKYFSQSFKTRFGISPSKLL